MSQLTKLYFIRHAEVEAAYQGVYGGRIDMGLSPAGHDQAQHLATHLRRLKIDAVYASPMRRVRETMAPWNGAAPAPTFLDALREVDFGDWTGLSFQHIRKRYQAEPWEWLEWLQDGKMPRAENATQLTARLEPCLRKILAAHPGQHVAVFAHGGVLRMLLAILLQLPLAKMVCFDFEYAGLSEIDHVTGRGVEIQTLNFIPWKQP
jgi:broad specificity phosphatase PhoE